MGSPTKEKLSRRIMGFTMSSTQSWRRRSFKEPASSSLLATPVRFLLHHIHAVESRFPSPNFLLSHPRLPAFPASFKREWRCQRLALGSFFPLPEPTVLTGISSFMESQCSPSPRVFLRVKVQFLVSPKTAREISRPGSNARSYVTELWTSPEAEGMEDEK